MTQSIASSGFLNDLFVPLPASREERPKDTFDHISDYADTSSGAWDIFRVGNHVFSVIEMYLPKTHPFSGTAGKVKEVFNTAGIGLSIPQLLSDLNTLRRSIASLFTVQDLPYSDPLRGAKI